MIQEMESPVDLFPPGEGSVLFILGNGFDLNLGFPTRYKDYYESELFPFVSNDHTCHTLGRYVYKRGVLEKWYDLEDLLAEYGDSRVGRSDDVDGDKQDFRRLVHGLKQYLSEISYEQPKADSIAARLLYAADDDLVPPTIYTFNYTDFGVISEALGLGYSVAHHVHGSIKNDDIVLGVGEYVSVREGESYLYKTSYVEYNSNDILRAFERYDTIIIFGLSLSRVDYPYFEDFFKDVSSRTYLEGRKKYIRIFTYDEKSRMETLDNLRKMNSGLIKILGYSDFDIIRTCDDTDSEKVEDVVNHLSKRWKVVAN